MAPLAWLRRLCSSNVHHVRRIVVVHADGHPSLRVGWVKGDSGTSKGWRFLLHQGIESSVKSSPFLPSRTRNFIVVMETNMVHVFVRSFQPFLGVRLLSGGDGDRHADAERLGQHLHGVAGALVA